MSKAKVKMPETHFEQVPVSAVKALDSVEHGVKQTATKGKEAATRAAKRSK